VSFLTAADGKNRVHHDERVLAEYVSTIVRWPLTISGDGTTIAYALNDDKDPRVIWGDRILRGFSHPWNPLLSRDGSRIAYAVSLGGGWAVVVNGELKDENTTWPAMSPDGKVAWGRKSDDKWSIVVDGSVVSEVDHSVSSVIISDNGDHVAYVTRTDSGFRIVVNGKPGKTYKGIQDPVLSPDGQVSAYRIYSSTVVIGDREYPAEGIVRGPLFSVDGTQVGYGQLLGQGIWWRSIDLK